MLFNNMAYLPVKLGRQPNIERLQYSVKIMTGGNVLGDIYIGDNVTISVVTLATKDIPDIAIVVGNPSRIVQLNKESQHGFVRICI